MEEFKKEYFAKIEKCKVCRDTVIDCETKYKDINEKIRVPKSVMILDYIFYLQETYIENKQSINKCSDCIYSTI